MQCTENEELCLFLIILEDYWKIRIECKLKIREHGVITDLFNTHNVKVVYNFTQHSKHSRKFYPYLLCKYERGKAMRNFSSYKYEMMKITNKYLHKNLHIIMRTKHE